MARMDMVIDGRTPVAQRWCSLALLHDRIVSYLEQGLQPAHGLTVREFSLLELLSQQHGGQGGHLQMKELATAVALSQSATTRLVDRLEDRGLLARYICPTDRRGIYTDVRPEGRALLEAARPTNAAALNEILNDLAADPKMAPFIDLLRTDPRS